MKLKEYNRGLSIGLSKIYPSGSNKAGTYTVRVSIEHLTIYDKDFNSLEEANKVFADKMFILDSMMDQLAEGSD